MPMMLIVPSGFITGRLNEQDQKTMVPILTKRTFFEPFFEFGLQMDSTGGLLIEGKASKSFRNMVARDGIEPPTPAFSVLISKLTG
jgi:hypothetical protein